MLGTLEHEAGATPRRPIVRALRAAAALALGGLNAMEVLALVVGFASVVGLGWALGGAPEGLVTTPWLRAGWVLAVIAVLRPFTWIPWVLAFLAIRRSGRAVAPGSRPWALNGLSNAGAAAILVLAVWLVFSTAEGAARWAASALGFVAGTVRFADLGTATGHWNPARIAALAAAFLLIRPVVPSLRLDLDLAARPLLDFVDGPRGKLDRWLTGIAGVLAVGALLAGVLG